MLYNIILIVPVLMFFKLKFIPEYTVMVVTGQRN